MIESRKCLIFYTRYINVMFIIWIILMRSLSHLHQLLLFFWEKKQYIHYNFRGLFVIFYAINICIRCKLHEVCINLYFEQLHFRLQHISNKFKDILGIRFKDESQKLLERLVLKLVHLPIAQHGPTFVTYT